VERIGDTLSLLDEKGVCSGALSGLPCVEVRATGGGQALVCSGAVSGLRPTALYNAVPWLDAVIHDTTSSQRPALHSAAVIISQKGLRLARGLPLGH